MNNETVTMLATIRWRTAAEGGLETQDPTSGVEPSFAVGGDLIMSIIDSEDGYPMARGNWCNVRITLPYGKRFESEIRVGMPVKLQAGKRTMAEGTVTRFPV